MGEGERDDPADPLYELFAKVRSALDAREQAMTEEQRAEWFRLWWKRFEARRRGAVQSER